MKINPIARAVKTALFTGAALSVAVPVTYAQTEEALEEVVVTGSRIKRDGFTSVSPVTVTTAQDIRISGQTRIEDLLNQLPSIEVSQNSFISNGASGTASVDLRGLGSNRTLVLVNGRRLQPGGVSSQAPDINQIPAALVERVEVLTGGASATYGADAVAGVVNFVMKTDFDGFEATIGASGFQHDNDNQYIQDLMTDRGFDFPTGGSGIDGKAYNVDISLGSDFADGKGHAVAYATYRTNDALLQGSRDYSSCALQSVFRTSGDFVRCGGSANAIIPNFINAPTATEPNYTYWTLDRAGNGFDTGSFNPSPYNYAPVNHFMRPDKRYSLGGFFNYEVNDNFKPFLETAFMNDRTEAQIAESGTFFNTLYDIPFDSPLLSDVQRGQLTSELGLVAGDTFQTYIGKRNVEGGPRTNIFEHSSFRIVLGATGKISENWDYDASYQYGQTSSSSVYVNDFFGPSIVEALSNDCGTAADPTCIPYEVFTLNGVTTEQAIPLLGTGILAGVTKERIFNAFVTGSLDASLPGADSPIAVVFGVETREEIYQNTADSVFADGSLLGQGGPTPSVKGSYSVDEFFAEANIPVLDGNQDLSVDLAYRYSDYDVSGSASTYKIGGEYSPMNSVRLRGGFNRAVRVPNVSELFTPQSLGLWNGTDPCAGATPSLSLAECERTGVTPAQYGNISFSPANQYNGLFGGSVATKPETADTITFGVVANPLDSLQVSVDYWQIEIEDVIGTIGGQFITELCGTTGDAFYCDNVNRNPAGNLWAGQAAFVKDVTGNQGTNKYSGIDLAASYDFDIGGGSVNATVQGTFIIDKTVEPVDNDNPAAAAAVYDCAGDLSTNCFASPEWRHTFSVTYDRGGAWSANAKWRYQGKVNYYETNDLIASDNLDDAINYFDLSASYDVTENIALLAGVSNVLDEEPPLLANGPTLNGNSPNGNYDILGRYLFGSVTFKY